MKEKMMSILAPRICLNRYYLAEGVRIYSQVHQPPNYPCFETLEEFHRYQMVKFKLHRDIIGISGTFFQAFK
jgi:hypothetical protein